MNAFTAAQSVESRGKELLKPWLLEQSDSGAVVWTTKGALHRELQEDFGDVLFNTPGEQVWCAELKVEERWTGNLFLEVWSNRNLESRDNHTRLGSNVGWMLKQKADLLFYYFLDVDRLLVMPLFQLKRWAFGYGDIVGQIWKYDQKKQGRYQQMNDTWGAIVKVSDLQGKVRVRQFSLKQLSMLDEHA